MTFDLPRPQCCHQTCIFLLSVHCVNDVTVKNFISSSWLLNTLHSVRHLTLYSSHDTLIYTCTYIGEVVWLNSIMCLTIPDHTEQAPGNCWSSLESDSSVGISLSLSISLFYNTSDIRYESSDDSLTHWSSFCGPFGDHFKTANMRTGFF